MAAVPDAAMRLADDIQWTTDLGNAFLAQQADVMDAVQRMRKKAQDNGALESNEQQMVATEVVEQKTVIVVQPAQPEVIYVPSYSPTVVYGPPPSTTRTRRSTTLRTRPAARLSRSASASPGAPRSGAVRAAVAVGGSNDININVNNNFNRNTNINAGGGNWQHNAQHRGGTPYADKATASKYGGSARGDSLSSRQASARQQGPSAGTSNRAGSAGPSAATVEPGPSAGTANRAGSTGPSAGTANRAGARAERGHRQPCCAERGHRKPRRRRPYRQPQHSVEQRTEPQRLRGQLERLQRRERTVGELARRFQHGVHGVPGRRRTSEVRR